MDDSGYAGGQLPSLFGGNLMVTPRRSPRNLHGSFHELGGLPSPPTVTTSTTDAAAQQQRAPPPAAKPRAAGEDHGPYVECSHIGCGWRSNARQSYHRKQCLAVHESGFAHHKDHFFAQQDSCPCCQQMIRDGKWTTMGPDDPDKGVFRCGHTGCPWVSDCLRPANRRINVANHEKSLAGHDRHFKEDRETCKACQDLLNNGTWKLSDEDNEDSRVTGGSEDFICRHGACGFRSNAATASNRRQCVWAHEETRNKKHMEHFKKDGQTCTRCGDLVKSGIWSADDGGVISSGIAQRDYACRHLGCNWSSTASTATARHRYVQRHERTSGCHAQHYLSDHARCELCKELVTTGIWRPDSMEGFGGVDTKPTRPAPPPPPMPVVTPPVPSPQHLTAASPGVSNLLQRRQARARATFGETTPTPNGGVPFPAVVATDPMPPPRRGVKRQRAPATPTGWMTRDGGPPMLVALTPNNHEVHFLQCTSCRKWRRISGVDEWNDGKSKVWVCANNRDTNFRSCEAAQEVSNEDMQKVVAYADKKRDKPSTPDDDAIISIGEYLTDEPSAKRDAPLSLVFGEATGSGGKLSPFSSGVLPPLLGATTPSSNSNGTPPQGLSPGSVPIVTPSFLANLSFATQIPTTPGAMPMEGLIPTSARGAGAMLPPATPGTLAALQSPGMQRNIGIMTPSLLNMSGHFAMPSPRVNPGVPTPRTQHLIQLMADVPNMLPTPNDGAGHFQFPISLHSPRDQDPHAAHQSAVPNVGDVVTPSAFFGTHGVYTPRQTGMTPQMESHFGPLLEAAAAAAAAQTPH